MTRTRRKPRSNMLEWRIRVARAEANMNQLELAILLNTEYNLVVDQNSISMMEKGDRFVKDYEIIALAKALNRHPMWLLFGDQIPAEFRQKN